MKEKKKKGQRQQWLVMGLFMLIGALCGLLMVSFLEQRSTADSSTAEDFISLAVLLLGMYIGIFLHIVIHEAGHLVFGLKSGYQFSSFRIKIKRITDTMSSVTSFLSQLIYNSQFYFRLTHPLYLLDLFHCPHHQFY